ncbi:MAG: proton-conducting transporter membrane subunit [Thermaerobacter sp.]|nr:proton-conducting transporter membrane subunit [Thermaerobacter sp.]
MSLVASLLALWDRPGTRAANHYLEIFQSLLTLALGVLGLLGPAANVAIATIWGSWTLQVGIDPLSSFFLAVLGIVQLATAVYGTRYTLHYTRGQQVLIRTLVPQFTMSMALVLVARDAITFLIAWELMSLTSFGLVVVEHHRGEVRKAGFLYLVATHTGALALMGLFAALAAHGLGTGFQSYAHGVPLLGTGLRSLLLLAGLVGFGSKAAIVPFHVWLPRAHPVAPSHVSALMSGVMIKVAIYGLVRLVFGWLGVGPLWWAMLLIAVGVTSSLVGVLYALMEHGLKKLLAYHSIENVGIIVLGLGAAALGRSLGDPILYEFALAAALFHVLNHAIFKSGLFLTVGSVRAATGTDDLERLGGLARIMPWTTGAFVVLSMAIVGLPPFNGFASEWMTLQSLLRLAHGAAPAVMAAAVVGALGLALTGGLAGACFVKAAGVGFLGPRRTAGAGAVREAAWPMLAGPLALSALSLGLGLVPGVLGSLGMRIAAGLAQVRLGRTPSALALSVPWTRPDRPLYLLLGAAAGALVLMFALRRGTRTQAVRPPWACGGEVAVANAYTATSFSKSIRQIFATFYRPQRSLVRVGTTLPYLPADVRYESAVRHVIDQHLYLPVQRGALRSARFLRRLQSGSLRQYIGYLLFTLLLALVTVGR